MKQVFATALIASAIFFSCGAPKTPEAEATAPAADSITVSTDSTATAAPADVYACKMDCEKGKTYAAPGDCPVCKMPLEKK